ncbi:hypothetical protein V8G54_011710 [Vigna mungo]|uniref:Uncharacterized protein n=1 Tax=Vigna mungo TaxID=3915 RepID=A0AAQ3NPS9_VIGMU
MVMQSIFLVFLVFIHKWNKLFNLYVKIKKLRVITLHLKIIAFWGPATSHHYLRLITYYRSLTLQICVYICVPNNTTLIEWLHREKPNQAINFNRFFSLPGS